jgi:hypothetical protein
MTLVTRLNLRQPRRCLQMKLVLGPARILKEQKGCPQNAEILHVHLAVALIYSKARKTIKSLPNFI